MSNLLIGTIGKECSVAEYWFETDTIRLEFPAENIVDGGYWTESFYPKETEECKCIACFDLEDKIIKCLIHESIHAVIFKIESQRASCDYDNLNYIREVTDIEDGVFPE